MDDIRDVEARAHGIAVRVAELLNEMRELAPTAVGVGPGRISGPGVQVVLTPRGFDVRS